MMKAHVVDVASLYNTSLISAGTTNYDDAMGLMSLTTTYPQLYGEQFPLLTNDPCYPQKLIWIECSDDPIRRVTALYLGAANLFATLPDFSTMDALEKIYLNNNLLKGSIPEFLGNLPELTYLNLAYNRFTGPIPASLWRNNNIELITTGNPLCRSVVNSCSPPPNPKYLEPPPFGGGGGDKSNLPKILGVTITPAFLLSVAAAVYLHHNKQKSDLCGTIVAGVGACAGGVPPH